MQSNNADPKNTQSSQTPPISRLLQYVVPYTLGFVFSIIGMIVVASTETGLAALMKPMLDGSFVNKDPQTIRFVPLAIMGIFIIRGVAGFAANYGMSWVSRSVVRDMRREVYSHLMDLPTRFYDQHSAGHLSSKLVYDAEQVGLATSNAITIIIRDTFTIIGLLAWMVYLNWQLSLIFVVISPAITFLMLLISRRFRVISRRIQRSIGNVSQAAQQLVSGQRIVKIFGAKQQENQAFRKINEFTSKQQLKMAMTSALSVPVSQILAAAAISGLLYVATKPSFLESITVGTFMSFVTAAMLLLAPMKRLAKVMASWEKGMAAALSIFELLDHPKEQDKGTIAVDRVKGDIEFSHVNFGYVEDRNLALHDVSFRIHPGQTVAIVGKSGSGKSTLVNLIPRLYELESGTIKIDGISITDMKLDDLRRQIALVSQDITLFNDTVANNIAFGKRDHVDESKIFEAAEAANAMEFIEKLPDGIHTQIGDKGNSLSGGQRQRIAIARAIFKNAPILILDEATSALDTHAERYIQSALDRLMKGRTTLVIAHRLSTIENADIILVMSDGKIVEQGNHSGLISCDGLYAALHRMQFKDKDVVNA